jgi:alkaline phosphatase D
MGNAVNSGKLYTSSDIDYTVKLEAGGLEPFTQYYYQFNVCGSSNFSPIGSAKTAPRPDDKLTQLKLAVYSCSNCKYYSGGLMTNRERTDHFLDNFGFFNAFGNSARKHSVDFVVHLGDFIYEYAEGAYGWGYSIDRIPKPNVELRTLYDYRRRHASYRADPDTLLSAQTYTWISVWDDHEIADNVWRDGVADQNNTLASYLQYDVEFGGEHVSFDQRKMNAVRAFFEFHPVRLVDMDDNLRIWRSFNLGTLVDLVMLDTRNYDRSITDLYWNTEYIKDISNDAGRSMMGARQESWFYNQLSESNDRGAAWRLIGSQTGKLAPAQERPWTAS